MTAEDLSAESEKPSKKAKKRQAKKAAAAAAAAAAAVAAVSAAPAAATAVLEGRHQQLQADPSDGGDGVEVEMVEVSTSSESDELEKGGDEVGAQLAVKVQQLIVIESFNWVSFSCGMNYRIPLLGMFITDFVFNLSSKGGSVYVFLLIFGNRLHHSPLFDECKTLFSFMTLVQ